MLLKMKLLPYLILALHIYLVASDPPSVNGGISCIACTIAVGLVEQLAQFHNHTVTDEVDQICGYLPESKYQHSCEVIVNLFGPVVIELLYEEETPDVICNILNLCHTDPGQKECHLYPIPVGGIYKAKQRHEHTFKKYLFQRYKTLDDPAFCKIPGIDILCHIIDQMETTFKPVFDIDLDGFSDTETLRGSDWRGKDCNDLNRDVYPGRKPDNHDIEYDSNCNGIYGVDSKTGIPYEDLFCNNTGSRGLIILGDSALAHFHIPEEWVLPSKISKGVFEHLPYVLENQIDWPMMSAATGHRNITWPIIQGPVHSVYLKLRERNRCNHRDYQNLGVNGADSFKMQQYQLSLIRDRIRDQPVVVTYALVGNDVCNGYVEDSVAHMTTPEQMKTNVLKTLHYLDSILPNDSHVMLMGLADARFLYELLHKRLHPFGVFRKDITYPGFYDYLNCLKISPCSGWMTTNTTLRNLTAERARALSQSLSQVATDYKTKFKNFDINYIDCPLETVMSKWEKQHGPGSSYQLIEPMDGFHPNQYAQSLVADFIWQYIETHFPTYVGDVNPNNEKIQQIFGDQGGH